MNGNLRVSMLEKSAVLQTLLTYLLTISKHTLAGLSFNSSMISLEFQPNVR